MKELKILKVMMRKKLKKNLSPKKKKKCMLLLKIKIKIQVMKALKKIKIT